MGHGREPIRHTCGEIDRYIITINSSIVHDRHLQDMEAKDLYDAASEMSARLVDCIEYLERLRSSNDTLRCWGIDEAEEVDSLRDEVDSLTKYVEELEQKLAV